MNILVVDDSATMSRILVNSIYRVGFTECVEAGDGKEGLEKFDASIQFVIADWNMPKMSGLDLARAIRQLPEGNQVPILRVTVRSMKEDIVAAIRAVVNDYIVKPFTLRVLKEKIDAVMSRQGAAALS